MTSSRRSSGGCSGADPVTGAALALVLACTPLAAQQPPQPAAVAIAAADSAAQRWLGALAGADYGGSWRAASPIFRQRITEQDWGALAAQWREQFERGPRRKLVDSRYQQVVPPPDSSEYVTLRYLTDLAPERPERRIFETLLLARDAEGEWRVADYLLWPNVNGDPVLVNDVRTVRPLPAPAPAAPPQQNVARPRR